MIIKNNMGEGSGLEAENILSAEAKRGMRFINCVLDAFSSEDKATILANPNYRHDTEAALVALMLNIRPAVGLEYKVAEPEKIQRFFEENGLDAFIYRNSFLVRRDAVQEDTELAEGLGYQEGMSVDEWLSMANPGGNAQERGIVGFFLGFPKSAINAYIKNDITTVQTVAIEGPFGGRALYFTTDAELAQAPDVTALREKSQATFKKAGMERFFTAQSTS